MDNWEGCKFWEANEDTQRQEEVGGDLPTIRVEEGSESDFEMQWEMAILGNFGSYEDQSNLSEHHGLILLKRC